MQFDHARQTVQSILKQKGIYPSANPSQQWMLFSHDWIDYYQNSMEEPPIFSSLEAAYDAKLKTLNRSVPVQPFYVASDEDSILVLALSKNTPDERNRWIDQMVAQHDANIRSSSSPAMDTSDALSSASTNATLPET